jgi:hypothetical protein
MVSSRTLRRKLQKKLKHKPYRRCPGCGKRMNCEIEEGDHKVGGPPWRLFKECVVRPITGGCGYREELFWSGGGTGRHIPHGGDAGRGKA